MARVSVLVKPAFVSIPADRDGDGGGHIEGLPGVGPAAADQALSAALAKSAGDRREPGEACHAFILDCAELGHLDEHREGGCRADAGMPARMSKRSFRPGSASRKAARAASIAST